MRVLVTGATGFVGFAVAAALVDGGHEVTALTRSGRSLPVGTQRIGGDVLDVGSVRDAVESSGAEAVCHLAARARVRDSRADPLGYWNTNVGGTLAVLQALTSCTGFPARLVVASTCAVYGERVAQPITEQALAQPTNPYGTSKLAADRAVADVAATGTIGAISLRAFNIAGASPGRPDDDESRLIPKIVAVAQGRAAELVVNGDGSVVRDYVHVADMADAFVRPRDDRPQPALFDTSRDDTAKDRRDRATREAADAVPGDDVRCVAVRRVPPVRRDPRRERRRGGEWRSWLLGLHDLGYETRVVCANLMT